MQAKETTNTSYKNRMIKGRNFDRVFFFFSPVFAGFLGVLLLAFPILVVPLWWLWLWLGDGPHLLATYTRTYVDPKERKRYKTLLAASLLWLFPGILAFALTKLSGEQGFFDLFLLFAALWSFYHAVRQYYGLLSIFSRQANSSKKLFQIDTYTLYILYWSFLVLFIFGHPFGRQSLQLSPVLSDVETGFFFALGTLVAIWAIFYLCFVIWRVYKRIAVKPGIYVLSRVLLHAFAFFLIGAFEPLYPSPTDPEQFFLAVAIVVGVVHSMEYLGIIIASNQKRYQDRSRMGISSYLGRKPWVMYGIALLFSLFYLILVASRGISPELSILQANSDFARICLAFYWGLFFHHYYLDQKIWRPHKDPSLRAEIGILEAS